MDKVVALSCRQEIYKEFSIDKKEALLLQRRRRYLQSRTQSLSNNLLVSSNNEKPSSFEVVDALPRQKTLTIIEPSCVNEKGCHDFTPVSGKGKGIAAAEVTKSHPKTLTIIEPSYLNEKATTFKTDGFTPVGDKRKSLASYEVGSTSASPQQRSYLEAANKASSSTASEQHIPEASTSRNKGSRLKYLGSWNFKKLPTNTSTLKRVPDCKYCRAKIFEYESEGFCCGSGSIKLTSHEMPAELLNLFRQL